ncbi:MAG: MtrB/PioB family outer membrane beta-barrel protein [Vicinamibacteria bacterium]|nr:MtrB/PioB family outer membrane beta-barrel protein [Vicinamibacteria bacterium]
MKRASTFTTLITLGLFVATVATAQDKPEATSTVENGGEITVGVTGYEDVDSSKFQEYREIPKGLSVPFFHLFSTGGKVDFNLYGYDVRQSDQRYDGWLNTSAFDIKFDYNEIPHNMGNDARTILAEVSEGVWAMPDQLQQSLGTTVVATPSAGRNLAFYDALLASTFASAGRVDISSARKRGTVEFDLSKKLPFDLAFSYMREKKSGYRSEGGGGVYSTVSSVVEMPEPLNEITEDLGLRAAYNFDKGNIHGSIHRNLYNNKAETLTVDNPFQWFDTPYVSSVGGGTRARWVMAPDNEATSTNLGFLLKFAKQTRISGDWSMGQWTQDAPFYPYTINTAILTPTGASASSLATLQQASLDGKIDTTTLNATFSSRPAKNLGVRVHFRSYELANKTDRFVITGDVGASPDRSWSVVTPSADSPYGHATANVYDTRTTRFSASASYDMGDLTLEGQYRHASLERTSREAETGDENAFAFTALYHASDKIGFRGTYDKNDRTAEGHTVYGFQSDEAERETERIGLDLELSPTDALSFTLAYFRKDVQYPNRPDRVPVTSGVPTAGGQPFPGTPSGLLDAKYDSFTGEVAFNPNERVAVGAYYTYEKDVTTNQWSTTTGLNLNNFLNYKGTDETDTFGFNGSFQLRPDVCTLVVNLQRQEVDGLLDITAREAGSFYTPGRTGLIPTGQGGAADILDWDDTTLTTFNAQLDYVLATNWTMSAGYLYEKYDFSDAYTAGDLMLPQSVLIFMKSNDGPYEANVVYAKLNYRF